MPPDQQPSPRDQVWSAQSPADHAVLDLAAAWAALYRDDPDEGGNRHFQDQAVRKLQQAFAAIRHRGLVEGLLAPREVYIGAMYLVEGWLAASSLARAGILRASTSYAIDTLLAHQQGTAEEPYVR